MKRLLWKEWREQIWFVLATVMSPILVIPFGLLIPYHSVVNDAGALAPCLILAAWGAAMGASERDGSHRALPMLPVPGITFRQAKAIPGVASGLVTALLAGFLGMIGGRFIRLNEVLGLAVIMVGIYLAAFGLALFATRGADTVRILARVKWVIANTVLITGVVVGTGILLYGRVWDGATMIGPTDQAVRRAALSLGDGRTAQRLTDDDRFEVTKRIAAEVAAPDTAANAVTYLANAPALRAQLGSSLAGREIGGAGNEHYDKVAADVEAAIQQLGLSGVMEIEQNTGIPRDLWAISLYLRGRLDKSGVSLTFLDPNMATLTDTVADVSRSIEVSILNSRDIRVAVRHREKPVAEVLASALTASYKYVYDSENKVSAQRTFDFYARQQAVAIRGFARAQAAVRGFRQAHKDTFMPDQVKQVIADASAAQRAVDEGQTRLDGLNARIAAATEYRRRLDARLAARPSAAGRDELIKVEGRIQELVELRAGEAAGLKGSRARVERLKRTLADLPAMNTQGQMLMAGFAAAAEELTDSSKKLQAAREELQKTEAAGSLSVRYWAGPAPGTARHPESPALEGATRRNWTAFISALLLSAVGSTALILATGRRDERAGNGPRSERVPQPERRLEIHERDVF